MLMYHYPPVWSDVFSLVYLHTSRCDVVLLCANRGHCYRNLHLDQHRRSSSETGRQKREARSHSSAPDGSRHDVDNRCAMKCLGKTPLFITTYVKSVESHTSVLSAACLVQRLSWRWRCWRLASCSRRTVIGCRTRNSTISRGATVLPSFRASFKYLPVLHR